MSDWESSVLVQPFSAQFLSVLQTECQCFSLLLEFSPNSSRISFGFFFLNQLRLMRSLYSERMGGNCLWLITFTML